VSHLFSGWDSCFAKCVIKIKMDKHAKDSINVCGIMFYGVVPYLRTYSINLKAHDETSFRVPRNTYG
jgi:hypothetical protein